jgi:hypothetical protein
MLFGWQVEYPCSDHHVKKIGVWLEDFSYEKAPGATGTLFYTIASTLADAALLGIHGGEAQYTVSVLGLTPTAVPPTPTTGSNAPAAILAAPLLQGQ